jgi:hypothetical protein
MYRCASAALAAFVLVAPACAQSVQRNFPADALRGTLVVTAPPEVTLNGQAARLAPGARIRGQNNMLEMSGSLVGISLVVNYTADTSGLVKDVWILTPDETRRPWPTSLEEAQAWVFDPIAQVWSRRR